MDERTIKRAAFEAVGDLELDCEIKEVCRSPDGSEWYVQFSGNYSQFCDEFQDQFERDNSVEVVREKIKRHLIKQVDKIRRTAGKARRPKSADQHADSNIIASPLDVIGDVISRASGIAGDVIEQAAGVAGAARETLSSVAENISPVTVEIKSSSSTKAKKPRASQARTTAKKRRSASHKRSKKTKASKAGAKASKRGRKAGAKKKGRKTK
ncbi:MAG: hypothetical protein DMF68_14330 [Acidobacteria bacterium]|nr:MAG: hypothetical protein DMF68_14330 [Acidobacteriota bacterium]